ncbi:MAG: hypothetical protein QOD06_2197, partial [Candidatus Binatota bacterium]|nr:hypothetical protein [Candidatus Binatota bacterium]
GEMRRVTYELLGKAVELARGRGGEAVAVAIGPGARDHAGDLAARGADRVLIADQPAFSEYMAEVWAPALAHAITQCSPESLIAPSTYFGRDLLPRVAARLGLGLTGDCIDLNLDGEGRLVQWKPAFGGSVVAPILSRTRPQMATVRPGMLTPFAPDPQRSAIVEPLPIGELPPARSRVLSRRSTAATDSARALDDAAVAIGVGRGIGGPEALQGIEALAALFGGAAIAATRDVADAGWLPRQHQVGLTGRAISPRLYVAIGIRGAFEHLVGVRRAGTIVAINRDAKAPMLRHADLAVIADWNELLVPLSNELGKLPRRSA